MQIRTIKLTLTETMLGPRSANSEANKEFINPKAPSPEDRAEEDLSSEETEKLLSARKKLAATQELAKQAVAQEKATGDTEEEEVKDMEDPTVFPRVTEGLIRQYPYLEGCPVGAVHLWDYQVRGFFKEACQSMRKVPGAACADLANFKTAINGLIFVQPRVIVPRSPSGEYLGLDKLGICVRPCRVDTAKGPRTFVAQSEEIPWGSTLEFRLKALVESVKAGKDGHISVWDMVSEWLSYGELKGLGPWRSGGHGSFLWDAADQAVWTKLESGCPVQTDSTKKATKTKAK